jgi:lipopolysaccharide/colanic/teichoic acid biosynthesis glycosyltransferase
MESQTADKQETTYSDGISQALPLWKRALDLVVILMLAPGVLIVGGVLALFIKTVSPGPVFFRQKRIGYKGREFLCYKFRTMHVNADTESHRSHLNNLIESQAPMQKLDAQRDPRMIPFAGIIRASGLDELAQLLNVARGEMSLVGPRPCVQYEFVLYTDEQKRRFDAVPGLTGLWQVSGKNRTTFNRMIELDVEYARTFSLWLDISIMARTFQALAVQCQDTLRMKRAGRTAVAATAGTSTISRPVSSVRA